MPAKKYLEDFQYDPEHFDFDKFRAAMVSEIDGDTDLTNTQITALTDANTAHEGTIKQLKLDKYDLLFKTGEKVEPVDPATRTPAGSGANEEMPSIDSLFKRETA